MLDSSAILDGRVLRSDRPADIDQEVYALLTVYQAIVRIAVDALTSHADADPDRISFTAAIEAARDQVTAATGKEQLPGRADPVAPIDQRAEAVEGQPAIGQSDC